MKIKMIPTAVVSTVLLASVCVLLVQAKTCASISHAIMPDDENRLAEMRLAGLRGDRSQVPAMIVALKKPPHEAYYDVTLHALAQLGATDALPVIKTVMDTAQEEHDLQLNNFARVAKARLLAESSVRDVKPKAAQAAAKVERFYTELGTTPADLNASISVSHYAVDHWDAADLAPPLSWQVYAMRELADMVYQGPYADYAPLTGMALVKFSLDDLAGLKVRVAALTPGQRIATLMEDLSHWKIWDKDGNYKLQLLADVGVSASRAAAAKLLDMDKHRDKYPRNGFRALTAVINAVGDSEQTSIVEQFDPSSSSGWTLRHGMKRLYVFGY